MKAEIYIFGNFADGYSQYPDNYTHELLELIGKSRKAESEIIYHREGALTYYVYTREISKADNTFIGIGYVFNDILIKDFTSLFSIFEDVITNIVVTGELLEFTNEGKLATKINQLYTHTKELQRVSEYLNNKLNSLAGIAEKLPPINFAISTAEWKSYSYTDVSDIQKSVVDYSNVRVLKGEGYNTDTLSSYAGKLSSLNKEKTAALQTIDKQKQEISDLKKKQKNYKLVIWLILIICVGCIIFIRKINDRDDTIRGLRSKNAEQEQTIISRNNEIGVLRDTIYSRNIKIQSLKTDKQNLEHKRDSLLKSNRTLTTEKNTLLNDKNNLTTKLNRTESTLKEANAKISKKDTEISELKTQVNNYKNSNNKKQYEKYKTKYKTACYYRDNSYNYKKTGDSYYKGATIIVYDTNYKYALTEKGYVLLSDLQKLN